MEADVTVVAVCLASLLPSSQTTVLTAVVELVASVSLALVKHFFLFRCEQWCPSSYFSMKVKRSKMLKYSFFFQLDIRVIIQSQ